MSKPQLTLINETLTTQIVDAELDNFTCIFDDDDCVKIDTEKFTYIRLSTQNLHDLIELIKKAKNRYEYNYSAKIPKT